MKTYGNFYYCCNVSVNLKLFKNGKLNALKLIDFAVLLTVYLMTT